MVSESLVISAALLAIGGLIILTGGDLGSASTVLHAGRVCLVLSVSLSIATALVVVVASRRWPEWKLPPRHIYFLAASILLAIVGYYVYGSQTGRILLTLATGSGVAAAISYYAYTSEEPVLEPSHRLAELLNRSTKRRVPRPTEVSIRTEQEQGSVSDKVDQCLYQCQYVDAMRMCVDNFKDNMLDIGTILLFHACHNPDFESCHQLVDAIGNECGVNQDQRVALYGIAAFFRGFVHNDCLRLDAANIATGSWPERFRDLLWGVIDHFDIKHLVEKMNNEAIVALAKEGVVLSASELQEMDQRHQKSAEHSPKSELYIVYSMLKQAPEIANIRQIVEDKIFSKIQLQELFELLDSSQS